MKSDTNSLGHNDDLNLWYSWGLFAAFLVAPNLPENIIIHLLGEPANYAKVTLQTNRVVCIIHHEEQLHWALVDCSIRPSFKLTYIDGLDDASSKVRRDETFNTTLQCLRQKFACFGVLLSSTDPQTDWRYNHPTERQMQLWAFCLSRDCSHLSSSRGGRSSRPTRNQSRRCWNGRRTK